MTKEYTFEVGQSVAVIPFRYGVAEPWENDLPVRIAKVVGIRKFGKRTRVTVNIDHGSSTSDYDATGQRFKRSTYTSDHIRPVAPDDEERMRFARYVYRVAFLARDLREADFGRLQLCDLQELHAKLCETRDLRKGGDEL